MRPVLTPEEMAAADRRAIAAGTPEAVLMERAGRAVAWFVRRTCGGLYGRRVVVACGTGNNGGDGLIAARVLGGWGARTDVVRIGAGIDAADLARVIARADVVVDAMYGTGFRGELVGDARAVADALARYDGPVVAVDIPSGVDGRTGEVRGVAVRADATVSFAAHKTGLCFEPGRSHAGAITVADIGIAVTGILGPDGTPAPPTGLTEGGDVAAWVPERAPDAHKWKAGCYVVGGSDGMTGAPLLVSRAAMRSGAGIVWCGVPGEEAAARASGSEVITKALAATGDGNLAVEGAAQVLGSLSRFRALAVGPGLGRSPETTIAVRALVREAQIPLVVDADGIHALAGHLDELRGRAAPTVLTPHEGEFAALLGNRPGPDRLVAARGLARETGAVVLLKGPGTVVADPTGRAAICPLGGPWLASAGTGDVLTGVIAGFLARGMPAFEAAAAAAFVHGSAADLAGHTGLMAGDLERAIPAALDRIQAPADPDHRTRPRE